jgi:hypothetical protein
MATSLRKKVPSSVMVSQVIVGGNPNPLWVATRNPPLWPEARMGTHCKAEANMKLRDLFFRKEK